MRKSRWYGGVPEAHMRVPSQNWALQLTAMSTIGVNKTHQGRESWANGRMVGDVYQEMMGVVKKERSKWRHWSINFRPVTLSSHHDKRSLPYGSPIPHLFIFPSLNVPLFTQSPSPRLRTVTFTSFYFVHIFHINLGLNALFTVHVGVYERLGCTESTTIRHEFYTGAFF